MRESGWYIIPETSRITEVHACNASQSDNTSCSLVFDRALEYPHHGKHLGNGATTPAPTKISVVSGTDD